MILLQLAIRLSDFCMFCLYRYNVHVIHPKAYGQLLACFSVFSCLGPSRQEWEYDLYKTAQIEQGH